jgi:ABC-2 type transport system ATP-binding protein
MNVSESAALSVDGLSHAYGVRRALDDVSFAIAPATFTVLLGLNGAGKSTLFSLVTRLYAIQRGAIGVFGHDISRNPGEALRRLGIVFQPRTLDLDLSVTQNLTYHAALHGIGAREARRRAGEVLARIALSDRANDKVRDLSGGQMRRVEIARALLHDPKLMLLDEPTVGLDIRARADILDHVRKLVGEDRVCALWATHLIDEVAADDNVIVLHQGRILAHGPVARILASTAAPDIRAAFTALVENGAPASAPAGAAA